VELGVRFEEHFLPVDAGILYVPLNSTTEDLDRTDPKVGVRYQFTPNIMAYAQPLVSLIVH
jgi:hypothetical protein